MAFLDFLKPRWSARKMTEDDRARRFWLLKATTSYSAWRQCRDRYAVFADLVRRQCAEEPLGRQGPQALARYIAAISSLIADGTIPPSERDNLEDDGATDWTGGTCTEIVRTLGLYDEGLGRLGRGDRDALLHAGRTPLEKAATLAEHQFEIYYVGGRNGGDNMEFHGKYVPAIKAALLWASENGGFRGGPSERTQTHLSESDQWLKPRDLRDASGVKTAMPGTHAALQEATAHLQHLPRVPEPANDVRVYTGEPCPVFGIYEPQIRDGMMAYMCKGLPAWRYGTSPNMPRLGMGVTWRLVWQDDRYRDGLVPGEELDYFPGSEIPPDLSRLVGVDLPYDWRPDEHVVQRSGERARYTGTWVAQDASQGRIFWPEGDALPQHGQKSVDWRYKGVLRPG